MSLDHVTIYNQPDCILPKSFFEGRFIPPFHPESLDYEQWWKEQTRRAKEGWSDGGFSVTGPYYHHLNFKKINMLDHNQIEHINHPYYSCEDQQLFADVQAAQQAKKGILLITGRGFGKSFDATTLAEHRFIYYPATEIIVSSSTDKYATLLWQKLDIGFNGLPDALRPSFLQDTKEIRESGLEIFEAGKKKKVGFRSIIRKIIYDNDEGATRGARPAIQIFEEIGSWTGKAKLKACYNTTIASWRRGKYVTCFPFLIGTGGAMKTGGSQDAEEMFWNPEPYNLMSFSYPDQKWFGGKPCARFFACFEKFEGFYEKSGVTDKVAAKQFHDELREQKKSDIGVYLQHTMEFPYDPYEAFRVDGSGLFDRIGLENRHQEISRDPELKNMVQRGRLEFINKTNIMAGVKWTKDKNGPIEILEHPEWVRNPDLHADGPIPHLYVAGCDSYDAFAEDNPGPDSRSKGSIFIFKRFWKADITGKIFVAKCTIRERNSTAFYWETVKLNMYYNSKMLFEYTNKGIAQHYIVNKITHLLQLRPKLEEVNLSRKSVSTNRFGLAMPYEVKVHCVKRYADYIDNYVENMYFLSQIEDALKFQFGSSAHDETMAASLAIVCDDDMHNVEIRERKLKAMRFPRFETINGRQAFK